jgi:hypothetical protein
MEITLKQCWSGKGRGEESSLGNSQFQVVFERLDGSYSLAAEKPEKCSPRQTVDSEQECLITDNICSQG